MADVVSELLEAPALADFRQGALGEADRLVASEAAREEEEASEVLEADRLAAEVQEEAGKIDAKFLLENFQLE